MKHTEGPLRAHEGLDYCAIYDAENNVVLETTHASFDDVTLWAAAPDLLAALKDLCDVASTEDLPRGVRNEAHKARAAIAKATGEAS